MWQYTGVKILMKKEYKFKKNSSQMLFFYNQSDYNQNFKSLKTDPIISHTLDDASNIIVWIAKQNKLRIIKGYFTEYQLDQMELIVDDLYEIRKTNKNIREFKPNVIIDVSHIPPNENYYNYKGL